MPTRISGVETDIARGLPPGRFSPEEAPAQTAAALA